MAQLASASEPQVWLYLVVLSLALAGVGALLLRRWQSRRALEHRLSELAMLAGVGRAILDAQLDLNRLGEVVYRQASQIVPTSIFQLGLFDADRYRLLIWVMDGRARPPMEFRLTPDSPGIVGWMRESRRSLLVRDFESERDSLPAQPRYISPDPPRSAVFVPLLVGDSVLGAIAIQSRKPGAFTESHLRLLTIVANHAAAALDNGRLYEQARRRAAQLELLAEVSQQINAIQPLPSLYQQVVGLAADKFAHYSVSFFECHADTLTLSATTRPEWQSQVPALTMALGLGNGIAAESALTRRPVLRQELPEFPRDMVETGAMPGPQPELAVPVEIDGQVLGVLHAHSRDGATFDESMVAVFESLGAQMAIAILEARVYAAERRRAEQLAALARASSAVTSTLDMDDLLDELLDLLAEREFFGYQHVRIFLAQGGKLEYCAGAGKGAARCEAEGLTYELSGPGLIARTGRTRKPMLVGDVTVEPDYIAGPDFEDTRSEMTAPMVMGPRLIGVFDVQSDKSHAFTADDLQILQTLADTLAVAVRNARLFDAERRRRHLAETLREVSTALTSTLSLDDVLDLILDGLARVVAYDAASILLVNDARQLVLRASRGSPGSAAALGAPVDVQLFPTGEDHPETVVFSEVDHRGAYHDLLGLPDPHACLGAVLALRGEHLGYLAVDRAGQAEFAPEEAELIAAFASQASVAIENARLYTAQREETWVNTALLQVAEAVVGRPTLDDGLETVALLIPMLVGVGRVAIYQWDAETEKFYARRVRGLEREAAADLQRLAASAPDLGIDVLAGALAQAVDCDLPPQLAALFGTRAGMVWPLRARGELLGAVLADRADVFGRRVSIMNGIAHQLTMVMENALLAREVAQQQRTERELELARGIQASFLPKECPSVPGWDVSAYWQAARQVGGDFYDFFPLRTDDGRERWGIVIADVADKGVPAALYMALSRTLMRTVAINRVSPATTLTRVNQLILADTQSSQFVTMFYAVWEPDTGRVRYAVGGHNPPLWARADGAVRSLAGRGAALGVFDDAQYEEYEIEMAPGDVLLLYTDGVPDAINADDEDFGMDRTSEVVRQMRPESAQHIVDAIARSVQTHVGQREAFDDLTMVVLKRAS